MKQVPAGNAKNNFGALLEDVAALGVVEIVRYGRPAPVNWGENHMIPPELACSASIVSQPHDCYEDEA